MGSPRSVLSGPEIGYCNMGCGTSKTDKNAAVATPTAPGPEFAPEAKSKESTHVEEPSIEKVGDEPIANPSASEPQGATQQELSKESEVEVEPTENATSAPGVEPSVQDPAPQQPEVAAKETKVEEEAGAAAADSFTKVDGVVEALEERNVEVNENTDVELTVDEKPKLCFFC